MLESIITVDGVRFVLCFDFTSGQWEYMRDDNLEPWRAIRAASLAALAASGASYLLKSYGAGVAA